jgi:hypothetical protein
MVEKTESFQVAAHPEAAPVARRTIPGATPKNQGCADTAKEIPRAPRVFLVPRSAFGV